MMFWYHAVQQSNKSLQIYRRTVQEAKRKYEHQSKYLSLTVQQFLEIVHQKSVVAVAIFSGMSKLKGKSRLPPTDNARNSILATL